MPCPPTRVAAIVAAIAAHNATDPALLPPAVGKRKPMAAYRFGGLQGTSGESGKCP
jgi:hypothetical protein